jgi:RNA polymerase sigma factor (sigma-70 family)
MRTDLITQFDGADVSSSIDNGLADFNEELLVAEAKGGSHIAFEKLVEPYRARIFQMARSVAQSHEDAEDVIQQSLHKAFVHLASFEGRSSFSTWLTRIALNEALMLRRTNQRVRHVSIDELRTTNGVSLAQEIADSRLNPEDSYYQRERHLLLRSAINELKPRMRAVLQLRDLDERSVQDTARILGVSVSALKSRILRGRRELREKLKKSRRTAITRESGQFRRERKSSCVFS